MQYKSEEEEEEDSFSFNVENKSFNFEDLPLTDDMSDIRMSGHPFDKHSAPKRNVTQKSLDIDTDDDDHQLNDVNPASLFSNPQSPSRNYSEKMLSQRLAEKVPSAGPSNRQLVDRIISPKLEENQESLSDSDESDELGIIKKKKITIPGEYDPAQYEHLEVNEEVKEIFQYITKYIPQQLNLDFKLKPFISEFIPAVGDIDAFLKVVPPEKTLLGEPYNETNSELGLNVLDEPAANQSDPALLHLQLRASSISVSHANEAMVVKKVDNVEKNLKTVDKWIKDVSELHRNKATAFVKYTNPMPDLDDLMQEWPDRFENSIKLQGIVEPILHENLSLYVDVICSVFDIPIYKSKIQSLHLLFSLYAAIKNSQQPQLYGIGNTINEGKDNTDTTFISKADHLVLD